MSARRPNPRQAKSNRSYSIRDVADLYGVHENTVRNWIQGGLDTIDDRRPVLIHGSSLNRFHKGRRDTARQSCGPAEMYCLGCRRPRRPAGDIADFHQSTEQFGTLIAICPVHGHMMSQRTSRARLVLFSKEIAVSHRPASGPIEESQQPNSNCDLSEERKRT
jgi:hypothetical protein